MFEAMMAYIGYQLGQILWLFIVLGLLLISFIITIVIIVIRDLFKKKPNDNIQNVTIQEHPVDRK